MAQDTAHLMNVLGITIPIIQAPMAGADTAQLAMAVSRAGGLGSLACAMLSPDQVRDQYNALRSQIQSPVNLNFFCHQQNEKSLLQQEKWLSRLLPYYSELNLDPHDIAPAAERKPFDEAYCRIIEEIRPPVISFHFGLPERGLLARAKATGAIILSSATTVEEGMWLERHGCDIVIAQGREAGGHRGMFLTSELTTQIPTADLVMQLSKMISVPIVATGGIADASDIKQAFLWGASAVQLGTAYLFCNEAHIAPLHRQALSEQRETVITNVFSGRPARGILNRFVREVGPICNEAPDFPYASALVSPLRKASEANNSIDFMQLWSGEVRKPHYVDSYNFTLQLNDRLI